MAYAIQAIVEHGNNGEGDNPIHLRLTNRTTLVALAVWQAPRLQRAADN
jgi:hypothetical protein